MPTADKKKAQSIINLFRDLVVVPLVEANSKAEIIRAAIVANGLQGQFSADLSSDLKDFVTGLEALASSSVVAEMESKYVPSYKSRALILEGVNDG